MKPWVLATILASLFAGIARAAEDGRPNIIYIVADDLGYADIGCQGISKDVKTPNIDALAAAGVRFTNGYVSCPVCSPTRAGLMTGRYQQRFGHEFNPGPAGAENFGLPTDQVTLPQTLKAAGYATGMVGKWHLGFKPEMHPLRRGFDEFYGFMGGAHPYNVQGRGQNVLMRGDKPVESTGYLTEVFAQEATAFVEKHAAARVKGGEGAKPYFLYFPFNAVHTPQEAPAKYLERFAEVKDEKRKMMLAMLSAMDDAVGQVIAAANKNGKDQNTLIVFHSDNGGPTKGNGSLNTPLRGFKGEVWEGGVKIPFMIKWTGWVPAGKVFDAPVISLDVFPTLLAAATVDAPKGVKFDGVNLLPFVTGKVVESEVPHQTLYWRYGIPKWAVRDGNFKLVHPDRNSEAQLYDLSKDPGEQKDLAAEQPDVVKRLQALHADWNAGLEKPRWQDSRNAGGKNAGKNAAPGAVEAD